jgi:hypothetical protein
MRPILPISALVTPLSIGCGFALLFVGCSSSGDDPPGSGQAGSGSAQAGSTATAGSTSVAGSGGTAPVAGTSSVAGAGGTATAGTSSGGTSSGGTPSGGTAAGGTSSAGTASGGTAAAGTSSGGTSSGGTSSGGSAGSAGAGGAVTTEKFSFFVTSLVAVRRESNNPNGFGGNLGGLTGADEICRKIAESSMPGSGAKGWRAFLSTSTVNAIDRVGTGPWYDRTGRVVAMNVAGLLGTRPAGDTAIINDLPNETGALNRAGTGTGSDDNHDTITGSNTEGKWDKGPTCQDWTSATGSDGPRVGHSWPAQSGMSWIQAHTAPGCEPSVALVQMGAGSGNGIGNGGGYGGFYCFALKP